MAAKEPFLIKLSPNMRGKLAKKLNLKNGLSTHVYKNFSNVVKEVQFEVFKGELNRVAHEAKRDLKKRITDQAFKWKPLSPKYRKWKEKEGLDTRTLIATGKYLRSIRVTSKMYGNNLSYQLGTRKDTHGPSGMPYIQLAQLMEYGSRKRKLPARPHWRPTIRKHRRLQQSRIKAAHKQVAKLILKQSNALLSAK